MIPEVAPAGPSEDIVTAHFDYAQLDREGAPVRVRLNSTAVRVRNLRDEEAVEVTYVREGSARRVRGRQPELQTGLTPRRPRSRPTAAPPRRNRAAR